MGSSIQQTLQKINSHITFSVIASLSISAAVLAGFIIYLYQTTNHTQDIEYREYGNALAPVETRPFGSITSKIYTYSWCQGADAIKSSNKIYFKDDRDAERKGRTLSKLCEK